MQTFVRNVRKMIVETPSGWLGFIPTAHFPQDCFSRKHFRQEMHGSANITPIHTILQIIQYDKQSDRTTKGDPTTNHQENKEIKNPEEINKIKRESKRKEFSSKAEMRNGEGSMMRKTMRRVPIHGRHSNLNLNFSCKLG